VKGTFDHIQYNVANPEKTVTFYRELLGYFEMNTLYEGDGVIGAGDGNTSLWVMPTDDDKKAAAFNRDASGLNHVGIHVASKDDVERFQSEFMTPRGIKAEFDTPRARPDFGETYYQVMFVDPEGLAIEVFCA